MQACCRCKNTAGFWVMAKDAQVVRRPWCLSCITEFLDLEQVRISRIGTLPRDRRAVISRDPQPGGTAGGESPGWLQR
jgi:hypothetical protein